jgi:hypothetical protein
MTNIDPLRSTVSVGLAPDAAFELFTAGFGSWWPAEFSWSQADLLQSIGMDCQPEGMLFEAARTASGSTGVVSSPGIRRPRSASYGRSPPIVFRFLTRTKPASSQ